MKLGQIIAHNSIKAVLIQTEEFRCCECCFDGLNCTINGLLKHCESGHLKSHDDGVFKQVDAPQP